MAKSRVSLIGLAPVLLAAAGCGIDSKVAGKWQGRDDQQVVTVQFDPSGEFHAASSGSPEQHGNWRVVYEDRTSAKLQLVSPTGVTEVVANFYTEGAATMRFGDRSFQMTMLEGPPKNYATAYFVVGLCITLTLIIFFRARRRAEEPGDMVEARRHAPKSLFHVEAAVDRGP